MNDEFAPAGSRDEQVISPAGRKDRGAVATNDTRQE